MQSTIFHRVLLPDVKYETLYSPLNKARSIKTQREYALPFPIVLPYLSFPLSPPVSLFPRETVMFLKAIDMADGQVPHPQVVYNKRVGRYRDAGTYRENEDMRRFQDAHGTRIRSPETEIRVQDRINRTTDGRMFLPFSPSF